MFRILTWIGRLLWHGSQPAAGQRVPVTLADGRLAEGYLSDGLLTEDRQFPDDRRFESRQFEDHQFEDPGFASAFTASRADTQRHAGEAASTGPFGTRVLVVPQPAPARPRPPRRGPWRRIPRWARWGIGVVIIAAFFRRAVAWTLLAALSATLHLFGANIGLPHVSFGWPWSPVTAASTSSTTLVGPIVLQKIEGIDKPALGTDNFNFVFTHTVSHNLAFWPCWYSATFYAVGHASATVDLNPGPAWWRPASGHYRLRVLRAPADSRQGAVAITMALPLPQLPQSVHDVSVDNTLSKPLSTDHSWTYPGFGCGTLIKPQFSESVLYAQAQDEAFHQATHLPSVTRPLIAAAEQQAATIIRDNFLTPTAAALGYTVSSFTLRWVAAGRP